VAEQLVDADFKGVVKLRHPTIGILNQRLIVDMGIADEYIVAELHTRSIEVVDNIAGAHGYL